MLMKQTGLLTQYSGWIVPKYFLISVFKQYFYHCHEILGDKYLCF